MNHPKVFKVLDFDGVICQSTDECMVTAYNAWNSMHGGKGFVTATDVIPQREAFLFRKGRGYVRGGGEYYVLLKTIKQNMAIKNQEHFSFLTHEWLKKVEEFSVFFYESRNRLMSKDLQNWVKLHVVFPEMADALKEHAVGCETIIVTMKDRKSIMTILGAAGIDFPSEKIFDKDDFRSKLDALKHFAEITGVSMKNIYFMDDNVMHLLDPLKAGVNVVMAGWGYHTDEHLEIANQNGIKVLELGKLECFFAR